MQELIANWLALVPALPLGAALFIGLTGRHMPRRWPSILGFAAVTSAAALCGFMVWVLPPDGTAVKRLLTWMAIGSLRVEFLLRLDGFSALLSLSILLLGLLTVAQAMGFSDNRHSQYHLISYLCLMVGGLLILVLSDGFPVLFLGWQLSGLATVLLTGFAYRDLDTNARSRRTFVIQRVGDLSLMTGMLLLFVVARDMSFAAVWDALPRLAPHLEPWLMLAAIAIVIAIAIRGAQGLLMFWLYDTTTAPFPAGGLIQTAGLLTPVLYILGRLWPLLQHIPGLLTALAALGGATAVLATASALAQKDTRRLLLSLAIASSGLVFLAAGTQVLWAGLHLVLGGTLSLMLLFVSVGSISHGAGGTFLLGRMALDHRRHTPAIAIGAAGILIHWALLLAAAGQATHGWIAATLWVVGGSIVILGGLALGRMVGLVCLSQPQEHVPETPPPQHATWSGRLTIGLAVALAGGGALTMMPTGSATASWLTTYAVGAVGGLLVPMPAIGLSLGLLSLAGCMSAAIVAVLYSRGAPRLAMTLTVGRLGSRVHDLLQRVYLFDEIIGAIVVRPTMWLAQLVADRFVERTLVEGGINLISFVTRSGGYVLQLFHRGYVQHYLAILFLAAAGLLYVLLR